MKDLGKIGRIEKIIEKYEITCAEDIYQSDRVSTRALKILEEICNIIGYAEE